MNITGLSEELELTEMPEGFHKVSVLLSDVEFDNLKKVSLRTAEGTYSSAVRRALGWPEYPRGLKAKLVAMVHERRGAS